MSRQLDRELGKLAVARGFATHDQVQDCLKSAQESPRPGNLAQVMLQQGIVNQRQAETLIRMLGETNDAPAATLLRVGPGTAFGRYEILSELGRGGMGAVYMARDPQLERIVALKVLSDRYLASEEDVHRFQRESKLAARLRHPNLVPIYEAGVLDGIPFFTMEYVEGRTLDQILVDELTFGARPDWMPRLRREDKVRVMIKVAEAVHVVHRAGIIHRDLKPGNIIVDSCLEPHVMDFGLAREIRSRTMLTSTGTAMGTPYYMPPEQARGDVHGLDVRADVYSMGAVLYQALTLRLPFMEATAPAVLRKVIDEEPVVPRKIDPTIDRGLERIVLKAMAKDRGERYASALDFARDLERHLAGRPIQARAPSIRTLARRWMKRHPAPAAAIGVALLLLTAFALYLFVRPGRLILETTPGGADVFVDDRHVGRTPLEAGLARGRHEVRVRLTGFQDLRFIVGITGGGSTHRKHDLQPVVGRISLESEPAGAEMSLRGPTEVTFKTPVHGLSIPQGRYQVEAFKPQHQRVVFQIDVLDQRPVTRKVVLPAAQRWQFQAPDAIQGGPVPADLNADQVVDVIFASRDGRVYALSGRDGRALWMHDLKTPGPTDPVVVDGDVVVGVGGTGFIRLRGSDGAVRYFVKTGHRTLVAAADGGDLVTATWDGVVSRWSGPALAELRTEVRWSATIEGRIAKLERPGPDRWSVSLEGGRTALVADGGRIEWVEAPAPKYAIGEDGYVVGPGWKFKADQAVRGRPIESDVDGDGFPEVVFGSDDHRVYVLDARTGAQRWYFQAGNNVSAPVAAADVTGDGIPEILFGTADGHLRAVSVASR